MLWILGTLLVLTLVALVALFRDERRIEAPGVGAEPGRRGTS